MKENNVIKFAIILAIGLILIMATIAFLGREEIAPQNFASDLNTFNSTEDIANFLKAHQSANYGRYGEVLMLAETTAKSGAAPAGNGAADYSTTNIQVAGVDEPDIVKNDGKYIYTVTGNQIVIVNAYPFEDMAIMSEINLSEFSARNIFINEDKLIVFGDEYMQVQLPETRCLSLDADVKCPITSSEQKTLILIYDVSDRENPQLERNISMDGSYFDSRMIENYVYVVSNKYLSWGYFVMPSVSNNGVVKDIASSDIYYPEINESSYQFTTIMALDISNGETSEKVLLNPSTSDLYVSEKNIYATYNQYRNEETTLISKISINKDQINFVASGNVPGHILNQFSMDEYNNHFRIATTISGYHDNKDTSTSNIYVLDENLNVTGAVEGIAPGESIYSVRFMEKRAYLVTFLHVDPLFVIDLSDETNPKILGKLKIPGYSDYLHPYDENHIIGIGKEVDASIDADKVHTEGAVYYTAIQGVKISIFDVTDVENPVEMSKVVIGDRGTESLATSDHKAFLFDKDKNLLVVPMVVAELKPGQSKSEQGDFTFSGAYVYRLTLEDGFELKGRITHYADNESFLNSGYYFAGGSSDIQRSLYMDNVLYTISNKMIKANNLNDIEEINKVELPYEEPYYYRYPYEVMIM